MARGGVTLRGVPLPGSAVLREKCPKRALLAQNGTSQRQMASQRVIVGAEALLAAAAPGLGTGTWPRRCRPEVAVSGIWPGKAAAPQGRVERSPPVPARAPGSV
ncbi:hypothetical protein GCM10009849_10970 [Sinomonas flava]|uniref:Uncharacterized protein n=1 Tax=Sinomonas flava TaxID=496857 RepID=A0ABN3BPE4_9MICC